MSANGMYLKLYSITIDDGTSLPKAYRTISCCHSRWLLMIFFVIQLVYSWWMHWSVDSLLSPGFNADLRDNYALRFCACWLVASSAPRRPWRVSSLKRRQSCEHGRLRTTTRTMSTHTARWRNDLLMMLFPCTYSTSSMRFSIGAGCSWYCLPPGLGSIPTCAVCYRVIIVWYWCRQYGDITDRLSSSLPRSQYAYDICAQFFSVDNCADIHWMSAQ